MRLKTAGIILGVVGLAATAIGMAHQTKPKAKATKKDSKNAWFYSSPFRDDLFNKALEKFQCEHPDVELTNELRFRIFREALDKFKDKLV